MELWTYLSSFFSGVVTSAGVIAVMFFLFRSFIGKKIQEDLERYKSALHENVETKLNVQVNELEKGLNKQTHELEKISQNFGLYSTRKHEVYHELYKKILQTQTIAVRLVGFSIEPGLYDYDEGEFIKYLEEHQVPENRKKEFANIYAKNRIEGIVAFKNYHKKEWRFEEGWTKWHEANNFLLESELYISKEVYKKAHETLLSLGKFLGELEASQNKKIESNKGKKNSELNTTREFIKELKEEMKKELIEGKL